MTLWPRGIDGRALAIPALKKLRNMAAVGGLNGLRLLDSMTEDRKELEDFEEVRREFRKMEARSERDGLVVWAGTGVGLVNDARCAKVIGIS